MRRKRIAVIAATLLLSSSVGGVALAKEGFFERWNPMRMFREAPARTETTPTSAHERLRSIRARMEARGLSPEVVERRASPRPRVNIPTDTRGFFNNLRANAQESPEAKPPERDFYDADQFQERPAPVYPSGAASESHAKPPEALPRAPRRTIPAERVRPTR